MDRLDATRIKTAGAILRVARQAGGEEGELYRHLGHVILSREQPRLHDYSRTRAGLRLWALGHGEEGPAGYALRGLGRQLGKVAAQRSDSWEAFLAEHPELKG